MPLRVKIECGSFAVGRGTAFSLSPDQNTFLRRCIVLGIYNSENGEKNAQFLRLCDCIACGIALK